MGALLEWLRQHASSVPPGEWIEGNGYRVQQLAERRHPTRAELDTVSRERPVFVLDGSGHQGAINSALGKGPAGPIAEYQVFAVLATRPPAAGAGAAGAAAGRGSVGLPGPDHGV
jgi:hypothetical protein